MALDELERRGSDHVRVEASLALANDGGRAFAASLGFVDIRTTAMMARKLAGAGLPPVPDDDED